MKRRFDEKALHLFNMISQNVFKPIGTYVNPKLLNLNGCHGFTTMSTMALRITTLGIAINNARLTIMRHKDIQPNDNAQQ